MLFNRENSPAEGGCQVFTDQPISLAMAYVPRQKWEDLYETGLGLERGTIFAQLDKPFIGEEAVPDGKKNITKR